MGIIMGTGLVNLFNDVHKPCPLLFYYLSEPVRFIALFSASFYNSFYSADI